MEWLKMASKNFFFQLIVMLLSFSFVFLLVFAGISSYTGNLSDKLTENPSNEVRVDIDGESTYLVDDLKKKRILVDVGIASDSSFTRIYSQAVEIRQRYHSHRRNLIFFYQQYYVFNIMEAIMILITTVLMLVVSKHGWDNVNKFVLMAFFVCGGFVAFFNVVPDSLRLNHNIHNNKSYLIRYENMEERVMSYLSTGENGDGDKISVKDYVHHIDNELVKNNDISFDLDRIPDQEFSFEKN